MKCPNPRLIPNPTFIRRYPEYAHKLLKDNKISLKSAISAGKLNELFKDIDVDVSPTLSVPCGKCMICKSNKQQEWIFRLKQELASCQLAAHFVTLTYNDAYLPFIGDDGKIHRLIDEVLTNADTHPTLVKRDLQLFLKRLRFNVEPLKLRYYAVGEYGGKTKRPHYHLLLFGLPSRTDHYDPLKEISDAWSMGQVDIGDVTGASINYVTAYMVSDKNAPWPLSEPCFCVMSRRPGIGASYLNSEERQRRWNMQTAPLVNNEAVCSHDGRRMPLPRYYKTKLFTDSARFTKMAVTYQREKRHLVTDYELTQQEIQLERAKVRNNILAKREETKKKHYF